MKIVSIEEYSRKYMVFERKLLNLATNGPGAASGRNQKVKFVLL